MDRRGSAASAPPSMESLPGAERSAVRCDGTGEKFPASQAVANVHFAIVLRALSRAGVVRGQDRSRGGQEDRRQRVDSRPGKKNVRRSSDGSGEASEGLREGELPAEASSRRRRAHQGDSSGRGFGKAAGSVATAEPVHRDAERWCTLEVLSAVTRERVTGLLGDWASPEHTAADPARGGQRAAIERWREPHGLPSAGYG